MTVQTSPAADRAATPAPHGARASAAGAIAVLGQAPLWIWWAVTDGGSARSHWVAGAIYLGALAVVLAIAEPPARPRGYPLLALAGFAGLVGFSALSAAWAPDAGAALESAAGKLLLLLALALPLLWPPSPRAAIAGAGVLTGTALLAGAVGLIRAGGDISTLVDGRLTEPLGYPNAMAALALAGALPPLWAAVHAPLGAPLRAACLGATGAATALALLPQSRGAAAGLALVLVVVLALSPARLRLLGALAVVAVAVAAVSGPLLGLRLDVLDDRAGSGVRNAALAVLGAAALAALGSLLVGLIPVRPRRPVSARARRLRIAGAVVVALAAVGLVTGGHPVSWTGDRIDSLSTAHYGELESPASRSRFTGDLGSNRTDYWRVAADLALAHPASGTGAGSFAGEYVARRHVYRYPWHAHSAPLETVAELGLPGVLFALAAAVGLVGGVVRQRRGGDPALLAIGLLLPAGVVAAQATVDWVASLALVSAPAVALAGAAAALAAPPAAGGPRLRTWTAIAAAALAVLLVPLFVGARYEERANRTWRTDPQAALADLARAAAWEPLTARPRLAEGIVALQAGQAARARDAFAAAAERDDNGWFARLELGLIEARAGDERAAREQIARARELNPGEPFVQRAVQRPGAQDPRVTALRILALPG